MCCSSKKQLKWVEFARSKLVFLPTYRNDQIIFKVQCYKSQILISLNHPCNILNDMWRFSLPKEENFPPQCGKSFISSGIP